MFLQESEDLLLEALHTGGAWDLKALQECIKGQKFKNFIEKKKTKGWIPSRGVTVKDKKFQNALTVYTWFVNSSAQNTMYGSATSIKQVGSYQFFLVTKGDSIQCAAIILDNGTRLKLCTIHSSITRFAQ